MALPAYWPRINFCPPMGVGLYVLCKGKQKYNSFQMFHGKKCETKTTFNFFIRLLAYLKISNLMMNKTEILPIFFENKNNYVCK